VSIRVYSWLNSSGTTEIPLHHFHENLGAKFADVNGVEAVEHYGDFLAEHAALTQTAGVLDLSFRSRVCLTGNDRAGFLHGQVTNDIKRLKSGEGCYAALTTAKARMESDLNIYALQDELLLDFEPGLAGKVSERLEKYIIAEDVQVVDVAPLYGLLSVQGHKAKVVVRGLALFGDVPRTNFDSRNVATEGLGEIYLMNQPRLSSIGFDLFVPLAAVAEIAQCLFAAVNRAGGRPCGWQAFETARIEAGIPRFGADMDETNLPLEAGLEDRAVSFTKGCYIGQEVISRIRTYGHVNKMLRGLLLADGLEKLPVKGDKLFHAAKEIGYITSAVASPSLKKNIALGYVRREVNQIDTELQLRTESGDSPATIIELPFKR
jgi:folate-binding protein YgfZ